MAAAEAAEAAAESTAEAPQPEYGWHLPATGDFRNGLVSYGIVHADWSATDPRIQCSWNSPERVGFRVCGWPTGADLSFDR